MIPYFRYRYVHDIDVMDLLIRILTNFVSFYFFLEKCFVKQKKPKKKKNLKKKKKKKTNNKKEKQE